MPFDMIRFFDTRGIPYATAGVNVSRGNVATHCPFCGPADEGQHLSVSIDGKGWRCWRHPDHRGKSPVGLVAALLNCSFEQAKQITGSDVFVPDDFMNRMQALLYPQATPAKAQQELLMPPTFKRFTGLPSARPYENYLFERGYVRKDLERLSKRYGLRYAVAGPFRGRIIFPIRFERELMSWVGRTISRNQELRYKALSDDAERAEDEGLPAALGKLTDFLLWFDKMRGGDALFLCEGPFDALRVDWVGRGHGFNATCCFTAAPSRAQIALLHTLAPLYRRRFVLLDAGAAHTAMRVSAELSALRFEIATLPAGIKDPAEMKKRGLRELCVEYARAP